MQDTRRRFPNLANRLPEMVNNRKIVQYPVRVDPASFSVMHRFNDGSYLPGYYTQEGENLRK